MAGFFGPSAFREELNDAVVSLDGGVSLPAVAVHLVGFIHEDEGGSVNLAADFFERVADACDAGVDFVEPALPALVFEDFPDEAQYGVGSGLEVFDFIFEPGDFLLPAFCSGGSDGDCTDGKSD